MHEHVRFKSKDTQIKMKKKPIYDVMSRLFDIVFSIVFFIISSPIFLIVVVAIKIEDGGDILYRQIRLGKDGEIFTIYKIRSMRVGLVEKEIKWTEIEDDRITKVGKFIRKTRIDEIPQLYNILMGQMKMIGPRPERPELAEEFYVKLPEFADRLAVKPGLTGLAQVSGGYDLTPAEKLNFDVEYIKYRSLSLDLKIMLKTMSVVLRGEGAR